jgi:translation initiation factor eIF-2B subunit delta
MSSRVVRTKQRLQYDDPDAVAKAEKRVVVKRAPAQRLVPLFAHLPQFEPLHSDFTRGSLAETVGLHPSVLRLGQQLAQGVVTGGTSRVTALLTALREVIADFDPTAASSTASTTSAGEHITEARRELERSLNRHVQYLVDSRPLSIAMGNAVRFVKSRLGVQALASTFQELQQQLLSDIDAFIEERIVFALETIFEAGAERIRDGDVVLTYDASYAVESILLRALRKLKRRFRVIVLDARPRCRGRALANRLLQHGVAHCTYGLLHAGPMLVPEANLVLLGAEACFSNGAVLAAAGTASVATLAKRERIPVVVACESLKFTERVLIDSICLNELGDPDELIRGTWIRPDVPRNDREETSHAPLDEHWRERYPELKLLHLYYDVTPGEAVDALITEFGLIPPSSVATVTLDMT